MRTLHFVLPCALLLLIAGGLLACGMNHNLLQSVAVSPAVADAKDYPNGQVPFVATAIYMDGKQIKPASALWSQGGPWTPGMGPQQPGVIRIDSNGLASCGSSAQGVYMIEATAPVDPRLPIAQMTMTTPQMSGAAQLTCP